MKKKEAMKVIAAAGIAIGGMGMFQDGNVVYAAELDQNGEGGSDELIFSAAEKTETSETQTEESTSETAEPYSEEINEDLLYTEQDPEYIQDVDVIDSTVPETDTVYEDSAVSGRS